MPPLLIRQPQLAARLQALDFGNTRTTWVIRCIARAAGYTRRGSQTKQRAYEWWFCETSDVPGDSRALPTREPLNGSISPRSNKIISYDIF